MSAVHTIQEPTTLKIETFINVRESFLESYKVCSRSHLVKRRFVALRHIAAHLGKEVAGWGKRGGQGGSGNGRL